MSQALLLLLSLCLSPQGGPDEQYQFVIGLAEKGMHNQVVREAESFLNSYPDHDKAVPTRYRLASAYYELGQLDQASSNFQPLAYLEGFEFRAESGLRLAQCQLAEQEFTTAAQTLEMVLSLEKEYLIQPVTFLLAEAWFRAGEFERAIPRYAEVQEVEEYSKDCFYGMTWSAFRLKKYSDAISYSEQFAARFAGDDLVSEMQFLAGEAYLESDDPTRALQSYTSANSGPFADAALRGAGFASAQLEDHTRASMYFGQLVAEYPDSRFRLEAMLQQGIHLLKAEQHEQALQVLMSQDLSPNPDALYWRAQAQQRNGYLEDAVATLEAGLTLNPEGELRGRMASARGDLLFDLGRHDEATAAYGEAESDYSLHAAAVASLNAGEPQRAADLARQLLSMYPDSPYIAKAQLALGEGLLQLKKYAEAAGVFGETADATGEATHRSRALSRKAWCHYLMEEHQFAAAAFAVVYNDHPDAEEADEAHYMHGRSLIEMEAEEEAAQVWLAYLENYPDSTHKAELLLRLGRMDSGEEGMKRLEELVASYGDSALAPRALMELGENHYKDGNITQAEEAFTNLLTKYPDNDLAPAGGYGLAWCLYDQERYAEAADVLRQVTAVAGESGKTKIQQSAFELRIWAEQKSENAEGAVAAFEGFAVTEPEETRLFEAARAVAMALRDAGEKQRASQFLSDVASQFGGKERASESMVEVVYLELDQDNPNAANDAMLTAHELAPDSATVAEAAFFVGEAWFALNESQKAVDAYQIASDNPECVVGAESKYKMGFTLLREGNVADASIAFGRLVNEHPKHALSGEGTFLYGECLFRLGQYDQAIEQFAALRSSQPLHEVTSKNLFRLGMALFQVDRYDDADQILTELITTFPEFSNLAEAELWRGRSLAALDKSRAARQAFERVLAIDKGVLSARAHIGIGLLSLAADEVDEALSSFLKVSVLYGTEAEVSEALYYAGACLEKQGDFDRAAAQYNEILTRYPDGEWAQKAQERLQALR